jgi:uncharacterized protein DUF4349
VTRWTLLPKRKLAIVLLVAMAALTACSAAGVATSAPAPRAPEGGNVQADAAKSVAGNGTSPAQGIPSLAISTRDLILTANVSMRASDPWAVSDSARSIASGLGGDLLGLSQGGSGENRSATLTIRVPAARFDDALSALKKLDGEVIASNVSAKDVTDQLVDLQARLTAAQALEQRYLQILAQAKTVDEILRVESTLANTRTQIEQLKAQQKTLNGQVAFSTITLSVSSVPVIGSADPKPLWDPAKTFDRAVAALSVLMRTAADLAIWLFVLGWIPLLALAIALAATRLRATRVPTA